MLSFFRHRIINTLLTPVIAGVVLGILAPFGTGSLSVPFRFVYWIGLTLAGGLGAMAAYAVLVRFRDASPTWVTAVVQSLGATLAVAPFVIGLNGSGAISGHLLSLFYIFVIAAVITTVAELAGRKTPPEVTDTRPPLLDRLPPKFRDAPLYAITSEDHYVRIYSEAGEHMLLMRLVDAEGLAAPLPGLKPHRSWWVAEAGVESVIKSDGKLRIHLKSGTDVPVSREGAKRVRATGWV